MYLPWMRALFWNQGMNIPLKGSLVYFFAMRCLAALRKKWRVFLRVDHFLTPDWAQNG
jgi:hypothetical protein